MTSIEIFERNLGTKHQNEAAAIVLTGAEKHITEPRALELIGYCIEDLMKGRTGQVGSEKC